MQNTELRVVLCISFTWLQCAARRVDILHPFTRRKLKMLEKLKKLKMKEKLNMLKKLEKLNMLNKIDKLQKLDKLKKLQ